MACDRLRIACALAFALAAALSLAACGRKGPLDPPPSAAIASPPPATAAPARYVDTTTPTGAPQPVQSAPLPAPQAAPAPQPPKKTFILDPLIQ